ncbi:MAG TPA: NifU family protein [Blastocatellia bacterium]|nr:NifU family protein [Blastocatellia bacterium]
MDEIRIVATVDQTDQQVCRFTVDRPVYEGSAAFSSKETAKGNPLAEKLFNVPGISKVEVSGNIVTLTKDAPEAWNAIGKRIGGSIRSFLQPPPDIPADQLLPSDVLRDRVKKLLDEQINPGVASHGGYVELIDVENNSVYLRMGGGCQGCGAADITLKMGIERMIREEIPQVYQVLDVTDHGSGQNPYYSPQK